MILSKMVSPKTDNCDISTIAIKPRWVSDGRVGTRRAIEEGLEYGLSI